LTILVIVGTSMDEHSLRSQVGMGSESDCLFGQLDRILWTSEQVVYTLTARSVYLAVQLTSSRLRLYVLLYGKRAFTHVRDYRNDSKTQVSFLEGSRGPDWKGSRAGCGPRAASWTTLRHGVKGFLVAGGQIFQRYFDLC